MTVPGSIVHPCYYSCSHLTLGYFGTSVTIWNNNMRFSPLALFAPMVTKNGADGDSLAPMVIFIGANGDELHHWRH